MLNQATLWIYFKLYLNIYIYIPSAGPPLHILLYIVLTYWCLVGIGEWSITTSNHHSTPSVPNRSCSLLVRPRFAACVSAKFWSKFWTCSISGSLALLRHFTKSLRQPARVSASAACVLSCFILAYLGCLIFQRGVFLARFLEGGKHLGHGRAHSDPNQNNLPGL